MLLGAVWWTCKSWEMEPRLWGKEDQGAENLHSRGVYEVPSEPTPLFVACNLTPVLHMLSCIECMLPKSLGVIARWWLMAQIIWGSSWVPWNDPWAWGKKTWVSLLTLWLCSVILFTLSCPLILICRMMIVNMKVEGKYVRTPYC